MTASWIREDFAYELGPVWARALEARAQKLLGEAFEERKVAGESAVLEDLLGPVYVLWITGVGGFDTVEDVLTGEVAIRVLPRLWSRVRDLGWCLASVEGEDRGFREALLLAVPQEKAAALRETAVELLGDRWTRIRASLATS